MDSGKTLLFQDQKQAIIKRAEKERQMLEPNTQQMTLPRRGAKKKQNKRGAASGGGGFGANSVTRTASQQADDLRAETVATDGVCLVESVLSSESAEQLKGCISDELARAYTAVEDDPASCIGRFNVPVETFDPLRGYLLLPLRDEASVEAAAASSEAAAATGGGLLTSAMKGLLAPGSPLGELFETTCAGSNAELYDLVALRTEPGANRQPIHSDTPYQKVPGLFCAFIALQDVSYSMGTTVFLPGTHTGSKGARKAFDDGQFDGRRDEMLSKVDSRYSMLKAGDAVFFNMNTLHAGTANFETADGGSQRLLFVLTFRNLKGKKPLGHLPNLRPGYRDRGITLADMRKELETSDPFAGVNKRDGTLFGTGL